MATGKVSRILVDKGFGFIRLDDGTEAFFHKSEVQREPGFQFDELTSGVEVECEVEMGPKGLRAERVTRA
jgi:CspA family cold shock protein